MSVKKLALVIIFLLAAILGVQIYALLTAPAREKAAGKAIVDGAIEEVQARMDAAKVQGRGEKRASTERRRASDNFKRC